MLILRTAKVAMFVMIPADVLLMKNYSRDAERRTMPLAISFDASGRKDQLGSYLGLEIGILK